MILAPGMFWKKGVSVADGCAVASLSPPPAVIGDMWECHLPLELREKRSKQGLQRAQMFTPHTG